MWEINVEKVLSLSSPHTTREDRQVNQLCLEHSMSNLENFVCISAHAKCSLQRVLLHSFSSFNVHAYFVHGDDAFIFLGLPSVSILLDGWTGCMTKDYICAMQTYFRLSLWQLYNELCVLCACVELHTLCIWKATRIMSQRNWNIWLKYLYHNLILKQEFVIYSQAGSGKKLWMDWVHTN